MRKFTFLLAWLFAFAGTYAQAPDNWSGDTDIDLFQESTTVHSGSYSCGVIVNSGIQGNCDFTNDVIIPVSEGDDFKFSFWAYTSEFVRITGVLDWVGATSQYTNDYIGPATAGWEQFVYEGTVPTGATGVNLRLRFYDVSGFAAPETQYVDDVEFESPVGEPLMVTNGDFESWPGLNPEPTNHPTDFTATANGANITLSWTDATGGQLPDAYLIKASTEDNIVAPVDGVYEADDLDLTDGSGAANVNYGEESFVFTSLPASTTYFFKIYAYTNAGTNIDYKTDGTVPSANATTANVVIISQEDFNSGWGGWITLSIIGDQVWSRDNTAGLNGSPCAYMNGYSGGAQDNEDWLISPSINFENTFNEVLDFYSAENYTGPQLELRVSTDYDGTGNPNDFTWTDLTDLATWSSGGYSWTQSGSIDVSGFSGPNVYFAFTYSSTTLGAALWEIDNVTISGESDILQVATPTFNPAPGNYSTPVDVTINCTTSGATIYYTTDGSEPTQASTEYTAPVNITGTTTLKARAYAAGMDPSLIASGEYLFPETVATLAELRSGVIGQQYILTGEVVLTYQQAWRNQKFVQDATAAILIDDAAGIITSDYEIGDGITGLKGTLGTFGGMLQFVPSEDPGDPTSAGNIITPEVVTISDFNANFEDYESELVKIEAATFADAGQDFQEGTVYEIADNSDAVGYFRTSFYDADYLYTPIPAVEVDLVGIANSTSSGNYFTSRFATDIVPLVTEPTIIVTSPDGYEMWVQGSTHDITWQNIDFSGNVSIQLLKGPFGTSNTLAENITNTGSWQWTIPIDQSPADNYKIRVIGVNPGDPLDESNDYFSIIEPQPVPQIVINEIMYNPSTALGSDDYYEYLELYNNSGFDVDLSGWYFANGVEFTFPQGTMMNDGAYLVLAINADTIMQHYGITNVLQWTGGNLGNSGETIELNASDGTTMDMVTYDDGGAWPSAPDGDGPSLELIDYNLDNSLPENWAASLINNGTPGTVNSVFGAEVLTLTYPNGGETFEQGKSETITWEYFGFTGYLKIELITAARGREVLAENIPVEDLLWDWEIPADQPTGDNFKIMISDMDDGDPMDESDGVFSIVQQIIPTLTVTAPNGGEVWAQGTAHNITWNYEFYTGDVMIQLSDGVNAPVLIEDSIPVTDQVYTWNIPADQAVGSNYTVIVSAMPSGDPMDESDAPFSITEPLPLPDLVINEIMYNSPGDDNEWIEIYNNDANTVDLEGYYILDDDDTHIPVVFPAGYSIAPGEYFTVSLELLSPPLPFVPDFVGDAQWSLGNSGDNVRIFLPNGQLIDNVAYLDNTPWPTAPDGNGPTLSLLEPSLDNSLPENWAASIQDGGTPGAENFPVEPTITVVTPNGGEDIQQGSTYAITWTSANFTGYVKIELLDQAAVASVIANNVPVADGSFDWMVTEAVGSNYTVRISDVEDGDPMDVSDGVFSIIPPAVLPDVVINEIMYNPPESGTDSLEFIELYNNSDITVNLMDWYFAAGVEFVFPDYELAAGDFVVVAVNADAMFNTFGVVALQWTSGGLSNGGEDIDLRNAAGDQIDLVNYDDGGAWPVAADGYGPSIGLIDPALDNAPGENWKPETQYTTLNAEGMPIYASPGEANFLAPAQGILISGGWTGISSYVDPTDPSIIPLMDLVVNDLVVMQDFNMIYFPMYNVNTIGNWDPQEGYQLKMNNTRYHVIYGPTVTNKTVDLAAGWNSLPVLSECPVDAATLFNGMSELIFVKEMGSDKIYWPGGGIFTLDFLMPGNAYFIKVDAATSVTFPECSAKSNSVQAISPVQPETAWNPVQATGTAHTIGFDAAAFDVLRTGDVIAAITSNGYCAGTVEVTGQNAAMVVWGDDVYTGLTDGFTDGENIDLRVYRPSTGETFDVTAVYDPAFADEGSFTNHGISFVSELKLEATGINDPQPVQVSIYPNPARDVLNINLSDATVTRVEIYSSLGQKVYDGQINGDRAQIDVSMLNNGYYFIKFVSNNSAIHETLSFIKK